MIIIIICGAIAGLLYSIKHPKKDDDGFQLLFVAFVVGGALIGLIITSLLESILPHQYSEEPFDSKGIVSLETLQGTTGQFTLGFGSIDTKTTYYYYEELENGGYQLKNVFAEDTIIFEDDNIPPQIKTYHRKLWQELFYASWKDTKSEIFIPTNSFIQEYNPNVSLGKGGLQ